MNEQEIANQEALFAALLGLADKATATFVVTRKSKMDMSENRA